MDRFAFGKNWAKYLADLTPERVRVAEESLARRLGVLHGKTFLDIGSGSGLFSLAARNLGARVVSFDCDADSVACTQRLKDEHHPGDDGWRVFQGSVLDAELLAGLGAFDIVYSWGVLHHTGAMWTALGNAAALVKDKGLFFIAIYNDQGGYSERWKRLKRFYLKLPPALQPAFALAFLALREIRPLLSHAVRLRLGVYFASKRPDRAMSFWTNWLDWMGGYPFEVAKPEAVFRFCQELGFSLLFLTTNRCEASCNEYVFKKARLD